MRAASAVQIITAAMLVSITAAQNALCAIFDQRTAIVNNKLYFTSGNYTFDDGKLAHNNSNLYFIDLSQTFDVTGPIDAKYIASSKLPSLDLTNGYGPKAGGYSGAFFYDHTMMYAYAAIIGPESNGSSNALWGFNTSSGSWGLTYVTGGKIAFGDNSEGVYASDPASGLSFYTGGNKIAFNDTNNGIVRFDASGELPEWNFATAQTGIQGPNILKGAMSYVRKGKAGVLIAFGGFNTAVEGTMFGSGWDWDYFDMSEIFIYDIYSNVWYQQTADGEVPPYRSEFCVSVSAAPDDSSFNIVIHAGFDLLSGLLMTDTYILSIPSFTWIKVTTSDDPDKKDGSNNGRCRHKCNIVNDRQFLVTGGLTDFNRETCNKTYPPMKVLDMTTLEWQTKFDPNAGSYEVPALVSQVVGGDEKGGATVNEPSGGWNDTDLSEIFAQTVPRDNYVPRNDTPPASNPGSPKASDSPDGTSSDTPIGAIVGGVIGGIAAICLIAGAVWFWRRRCTTQRAEMDANNEWKVEPKHQSIYEAEVHPGELPSEQRRQVWEMPNNSRPVEMYAGPMSPQKFPTRHMSPRNK